VFRYISQLKGLIIDIDSFSEDIAVWDDITNKFKCLFITSKDEIIGKLTSKYGPKATYKIEPFIKFFSPSPSTHFEALLKLNLLPIEVAYVSTDISFLKHASTFMGGTIWVAKEVNYEEASVAPDLICDSFLGLKNALDNNTKGFLGEIAIFPHKETHGMVIPVNLIADGSSIRLYMLGRYFNYSHYMNQLHPYSSAIYLNKKEGRPYFQKYDYYFSKLYGCVVKLIQRTTSVYGVCSVPTRPGKLNTEYPLCKYF